MPDGALLIAVKAGFFVFLLLQLVPLMVWIERKASAYMQDRIGPERASIFGLRFAGLFHTLADVGKMITKEDVIPAKADRFAYVLAPMVGLVVVLLSIAVLPLADSVQWGDVAVPMSIAQLDGVGILWVFAVSSLGVYGIILAGWASRSRYPLLGALRSAAQMVSYELPLGLAALTVPLVFGTLDPNALVRMQGESMFAGAPIPMWGILISPIGFIIFMISAFAETNRAPFDLPEGESEIVGFHVEYSSMKFGMFFMAEYIHILVASMVAATLFLGGWQIPFAGTQTLVSHPGIVLACLGGGLAVKGAFMIFFGRRATLRGTAAEGAGSSGLEKTILIGGGAALILAGIATAIVGPGLAIGPKGAGVIAAAAQFGCLLTKTLLLAFTFVWVRWTLPRFRYDQVMRLGWKQLLPLSLANLMLVAGMYALGWGQLPAMTGATP
jgi:NADH-quinone oxidoreductase subunit H